jgi:hypothetical protein
MSRAKPAFRRRSLEQEDGPGLPTQVIDFITEHTPRFDRRMAGNAAAPPMLNKP